ncbi:MAG: hypothetical protein JW741_03125 [Sedimentisphaerales bacterium]|nr:hypothetical protein [Sedimentisphaerales bacterium]
MQFSRVERAAIEAILSKSVDGIEIVRTQFAAASVTARDYTGVGFYTTISVPLSVPPMPDNKELRDALFDGAAACAKSDPDGWVFFKLWADGGYLVCLEACTASGSWPNEDDIEDVAPCDVYKDNRTRSSDDGLIPDCDNRFEVWRMNTSWKSLLATALVALIIILVVLLLVSVVV